MLSNQDNETLTRVGPGTPMGELMREFWIPACLPGELEPDGAPTRLMLLGEKLIAFRDTAGRVGIMDHRCPHRCASMFFGRNARGGLRCSYHGWKFDVDGNCLDMPNLPVDQQFMSKVKARAYKTAEYGGIVWVYMGKRAEAPPLPQLETLALADAERIVLCHQRDCNWLQSLEGDIDTSHFAFLHVGSLQPDDVAPDDIHRWGLIDRAPRYQIKETDWGAMYTAHRPADEGESYHRFAHFMFPFFALTPDGDFGNMIQASLSVPLDDTHTMIYNLSWTKREAPLRKRKDGNWIPGGEPMREFLPPTDDWLGRWRLAAGKANDYRIDRELQQTEQSYTGIQGVGQQDQAMVESMDGAVEGIVDRQLEHLAVSDRMIMLTRRKLLAAARAHHNDGSVPAVLDQPQLARAARGGSFIAPDDKDWLEAYREQVERAENPVGFLVAADW